MQCVRAAALEIFLNIHQLSATKWLEKYLKGFYSFSSKYAFLACCITEH